MRILTTVLVILLAVVLISSAVATPPGKNVEYSGAGWGKVIFDAKIHADKGFKCNDCHIKIFPLKRGTINITHKDMDAGKHCGACHDGTKAFKARDFANCMKCYKS